MSKIVKVEKITPKIYHFIFDSQVNMCDTLCRYQEHYESPKFAGEIFTLGVFREWYMKEYGGWTYNQDWAGFNFPDTVVKPFMDGLFDPLTEDETKVLQKLAFADSPYYVIGTSVEGRESVIQHEIMHGLFHTNSYYKQEVSDLLAKYDLTELKDYLRKLYNDKVILDECHAWIATSYFSLRYNKIKFPEEIINTLLDLKDRYLKVESAS